MTVISAAPARSWSYHGCERPRFVHTGALGVDHLDRCRGSPRIHADSQDSTLYAPVAARWPDPGPGTHRAGRRSRPCSDGLTNPEAKTERPCRLLDLGEATWRERALNAEDALKATQTEILAQRSRIGELLGRIRDVQAEWAEEAIQRITTENTTLKPRVRQLTADNRALDERLKAARSNLRFQDRRVADLEARLTGPEPPA
ncbi:hypothetical protein [Streptomyces sp. YS-3]|uniref:hypothetical protein n=1 Tax=Streptomyces sp. YS-3 TaxID=3381352 RepID=UPI0038629DC4